MGFGNTNGHAAGNGNGTGAGDAVGIDYTPIWPMVPGTRPISVTINGQQVEAEEGQTILQACRVLGIEVPTLCYEPKLAPYGACRICVVEEVGTAIAIRDSHRYCADRVLEVDAPAPIPWPKDPPSGRRVAIIGAGPAGLTVAYYLQLRGHACDVYEADPEQGGMLRYGIPQYRLPKGWMDRELNHVWELGATFKPNMRLGRDF